MISTLRRLGVDPQAIEQPLDLPVPENKMMLAFYLAVPEVENDRRALNVKDGMHRVRKEGRWMGQAVFGYANKTREDGTKFIWPKEPEASVMRWVFEEIAKGIHNTEDIWRMAQKRGFTKKKANFWQIIRNPVYCGKIIVPKNKNEEVSAAKGLHKPLITSMLFYEAQDVLDGRKRHYRTRMAVDEPIPLRGFLICPRCARNLSASASTGYSSRYCSCLKRSTPRDFKAMKAEYEKEILRLEVKINALSQEFNSAEIKQLVEKATTAIYPQNLEYDGHQFRTTHLNEVIATTFSLDAAFQKEKSRQNGVFSILSAKEVSSRFELL